MYTGNLHSKLAGKQSDLLLGYKTENYKKKNETDINAFNAMLSGVRSLTLTITRTKTVLVNEKITDDVGHTSRRLAFTGDKVLGRDVSRYWEVHHA